MGCDATTPRDLRYLCWERSARPKIKNKKERRKGQNLSSRSSQSKHSLIASAVSFALEKGDVRIWFTASTEKQEKNKWERREATKFAVYRRQVRIEDDTLSTEKMYFCWLCFAVSFFLTQTNLKVIGVMLHSHFKKKEEEEEEKKKKENKNNDNEHKQRNRIPRQGHTHYCGGNGKGLSLIQFEP